MAFSEPPTQEADMSCEHDVLWSGHVRHRCSVATRQHLTGAARRSHVHSSISTGFFFSLLDSWPRRTALLVPTGTCRTIETARIPGYIEVDTEHWRGQEWHPPAR